MSKFRLGTIVFLLMPLAASYNFWGGITFSLTSAELPNPAQWPLARIEEDTSGPPVFSGAKKMLFILGSPGVPLSKLVRLTVFGDFRPGLTIEQAADQFGPPVRIQSDRRATIAVYQLPDVRVEVEDQPFGSACSSYHRRTVYAYPKSSPKGCSASAAEVLHASVNAHIRKEDVVEVSILEAGDSQRVWVFVRDGCVQAINWAKLTSGK